METYLLALTSYFVIIDPIGTAVIFHGLTGDDDRRYILRMAIRSVIISTLIVLIFGFFGEKILTSLGISIESLRVAGGLLLFYTAFHMITRRRDEQEVKSLQVDISVYPLSIPLIAGPGCLTLTILLFSHENSRSIVPLVAAVMTIYLFTLACFLGSGLIRKIIGQTGDDILRRLLGVILAALAIQFIADGVKQIAAM
ncbi:MAG: MarC family protein [Desulfuromonas sp.]|nr:MAG: MarC family protein [Desulfuromonas sp.]